MVDRPVRVRRCDALDARQLARNVSVSTGSYGATASAQLLRAAALAGLSMSD